MKLKQKLGAQRALAQFFTGNLCQSHWFFYKAWCRECHRSTLGLWKSSINPPALNRCQASAIHYPTSQSTYPVSSRMYLMHNLNTYLRPVSVCVTDIWKNIIHIFSPWQVTPRRRKCMSPKLQLTGGNIYILVDSRSICWHIYDVHSLLGQASQLHSARYMEKV